MIKKLKPLSECDQTFLSIVPTMHKYFGGYINVWEDNYGRFNGYEWKWLPEWFEPENILEDELFEVL